MNFEDVTFYLTANSLPNPAILKKILEISAAVDLSGSMQPVFYNGLEGYGNEVEYEFELPPSEALKLSEKFVHNNFTFLEWDKDELLKEFSDILEELGEDSQLRTDSIFLLVGPHEILSLENKKIIKSEFSLAFYFEMPLQENVADLNLRIRKDRNFQEKLAILQEICHTNFTCFFGGA